MCLGVTSLAAREADPVRALADARDRHRVLLVFAPDAAAWQAQEKLWRSAGPAFTERDVIIIRGLSGDPAVAPLAQRFGVNAGEFCVILIGKDGHDARRFTKPVESEPINETIDSMPMRQAEMRQRR